MNRHFSITSDSDSYSEPEYSSLSDIQVNYLNIINIEKKIKVVVNSTEKRDLIRKRSIIQHNIKEIKKPIIQHINENENYILGKVKLFFDKIKRSISH